MDSKATWSRSFNEAFLILPAAPAFVNAARNMGRGQFPVSGSSGTSPMLKVGGQISSRVIQTLATFLRGGHDAQELERRVKLYGL